MAVTVDPKALIAEFVGTALLIYVGCGTAISCQSLDVFNPGTTLNNGFLVAVPLAFGIGVSTIVYAIAPISGGHINPAVSLAFLVLGIDMNVGKFIAYAVAQLAGSVLGALWLWGQSASPSLTAVADGPAFTLGSNSVAADLPAWSAFLGETGGTFILVWTVLMTAVYKKSIAENLAPIAIGWSVMLANFVLVPTSSASINPARTFGPAVVSWIGGIPFTSANSAWVFYTGPFVGAILAAVLAKSAYGVGEPEAPASGETQPLTQPSAGYQTTSYQKDQI